MLQSKLDKKVSPLLLLPFFFGFKLKAQLAKMLEKSLRVKAFSIATFLRHRYNEKRDSLCQVKNSYSLLINNNLDGKPLFESL